MKKLALLLVLLYGCAAPKRTPILVETTVTYTRVVRGGHAYLLVHEGNYTKEIHRGGR